VEDPVVAAAQPGGQEVRQALLADEGSRGWQDAHDVPGHLWVAHPDPAAVLDRPRLVEAPALLEGFLLLGRDARVLLEAGSRPAWGDEQDAEDEDGGQEEDGQRSDEATDDVTAHPRSILLER